MLRELAKSVKLPHVIETRATLTKTGRFSDPYPIIEGLT